MAIKRDKIFCVKIKALRKARGMVKVLCQDVDQDVATLGTEEKLWKPLLSYKRYKHTSNPFPHSLPVSPSPKMPNFAGEFLGYQTNNLFSALHTCSTTFLSRGCSRATGIVAATTEQRQRVITEVLQFLEQVCCRCCGGCPEGHAASHVCTMLCISG